MQQTAFQQFDQLVIERMQRGLPRRRAVLVVARKHPKLHRAMLVEGNRNMDPAVLAAVASGSRKLFADVPKDGVEAVKTGQVKVAAAAVQRSAPAVAPKPAPQLVTSSPPRQDAAELMTDPWCDYGDFGAAHGFYC